MMCTFSTCQVLLSAAVALACLPTHTDAHGMMVQPRPRQARDASLPQFANGSWPADTDGCDCANPKGGCHASTERRSGQSCLWFSQGCTIHCPKVRPGLCAAAMCFLVGHQV
eukprot:SAG31_NODE_1873_length_7024_cov_10.615018_2_plen_112_part_00